VGRATGEPHDIEMWFGVKQETLYLISGNGLGGLVWQPAG
jgi:hypothetical protein